MAEEVGERGDMARLVEGGNGRDDLRNQRVQTPVTNFSLWPKNELKLVGHHTAVPLLFVGENRITTPSIGLVKNQIGRSH